MPNGAKAKDPNTPYVVYGFEWRGKLFYVGICQEHSTRHTGRWTFVANKLHRRVSGIASARDEKQLHYPVNQVIASLIDAGAEEYSSVILWQGKGRASAAALEPVFIREHINAGCVLANKKLVRTPYTPAQVLDYLGVHRARVERVGKSAYRLRRGRRAPTLVTLNQVIAQSAKRMGITLN